MKPWQIRISPLTLPAGYVLIEQWDAAKHLPYYLVLRRETMTYVSRARQYLSYRKAVKAAQRSAFMVAYHQICAA